MSDAMRSGREPPKGAARRSRLPPRLRRRGGDRSAAKLLWLNHLELSFRRRRCRWCDAAPARCLPERFGARETRMRLSRAIEQFLDLRLLMPNDEPGSKRAVAALLRRQTLGMTFDDIGEKSLVRHDVVDPAQTILQLH